MKEIYRRPERRAKVQQDDDSGSTTSKFIVSETTEQFWSLRCSANVANDIMEMTGVSQRRTSDVRREVAFLVSEENSKCSTMQENHKISFMVDVPCFLNIIIIYFHSHPCDFAALEIQPAYLKARLCFKLV